MSDDGDKQTANILIVEDDEALRSLLEEELGDAGYQVSSVMDAESAWSHLQQHPVTLVLSDLRLPGADGIELLLKSKQLASPPGFIIITAFGTVEQAVDALKQGADDFLTKPLKLDHLRLSAERVIQTKRLQDEVRHYRKLLAEEGFHGMVGRSEPIHKLVDNIRQIARAAGPVLIIGESGTGKELVAQAVHKESERADKPFVAVNCAGIPPELLESELFGHVAGAFTGAQKARKGLFAEADGGTLLLDEIGEMPLEMQSKLLRILQDGQIRPVGANREVAVDVRIIAATNRSLEQEVSEKRFREDLYYRLETFTLKVPALRDRGDDIELLTAHFINRFNAHLRKQIHGIRPAALERLKGYSFPGNVRELSNAIERAVTFCQKEEIDVDDLPERLRASQAGQARNQSLEDNVGDGGHQLLKGNELPTLEELEQRYIQYVLDQLDGNKRRAAELLGIGRRTLYRRLENESVPEYD
ncbi:DNA-binding NtrC family response regulator [Methylohalomonas lacus]|uniref:DNA-binding NtrC family response regulator n=1 Tax=Methylohalomonas lacus TaxID=398773 RepID=A0AAE3L189_9GAMM|nr:sigma-54 dependent transcriptional regulator [Methylohalomonas lacus]MCS3903250.1 DNA-binding NtrC family response regulator [Methylohalomonas lacus]